MRNTSVFLKKSLLCLATFCIAMSLHVRVHAQYPSGSPVAINGKLQVIGSKLRNECGNPVQLRGMGSHGIQWYGKCINASSIEALANDWEIDVLRLAMYVHEGGYVTNPTNYKIWIDNIVSECGKRGIYVIIDFHVHLPGDPMYYIEEAREFWAYMAAQHANKKHVIYEICNEPSKVTWNRVKEYANEIIPIIRTRDTSTTIIVGSSTWSQDVDSVAMDRLPYPNLIYALHFYTQGERLRKKANIATAKGLPIFVSEFGTSNPQNTEGPFYEEMEIWNAWMADNKVSWANWSLADKNEPSAALLPGACNGSWNLTSASGTWVRAKIKSPLDNFACNGDTGTVEKANSRPFKGSPWQLPGKIEMENYDEGIVGVAYRDFTPGNNGSANLYRTGDVDLLSCTDLGNGYCVNATTAGEWLNFTVNVVAEGYYDFKVRVATYLKGQFFHIKMKDKVISGVVQVPNTGSGTKWTTVTIAKKFLTAGIQDMQVHMDGNGFNLNYVQVVPSLGNLVNNPPEVYLTSPVNKKVVSPPVNFVITAETKDSDGTVKKVEFYQNNIKIGEDTTKPFSFVWRNPVSGEYSITARAIDDKGGAALSGEEKLTVLDLRPKVSITYPVHNAVIDANAVEIKASALDHGGSVGKVEFYVDSLKVGESSVSPFICFAPAIDAGWHVVYAIVIDNNGNRDTSSHSQILLEGPHVNQFPVVTVTSPASGALWFTPAFLEIVVEEYDADGLVMKVDLFQNGTLLGSDTTFPYRFVWENVPAGNYELEAVATDDKGGKGSSKPVHIRIKDPVQNTPPIVSFVSPLHGEIKIAPASFLLKVDAIDPIGKVAKVEFFVDAMKIGACDSFPYEFQWEQVPPGAYVLTAQATDDSGAVASTSVDVLVENSTVRCDEEQNPAPSLWGLRNDWSDQNNGSRLTATEDALKITHRPWGQNKLFLIRSGQRNSIADGQVYTLSFDFKNDGMGWATAIELGLASGLQHNGPVLAQPFVAIPLQASADFVSYTTEVEAVFTGEAFLSLGIRWPAQNANQLHLFVKNVKICSSTSESSQRIEEAPSENKKENLLVAYPNPSADEFTLFLKGMKEKTAHFTIVNAIGVVVYEATHVANEMVSIGKSWPGGLFTLKVNDGETVKVLKLRKL